VFAHTVLFSESLLILIFKIELVLARQFVLYLPFGSFPAKKRTFFVVCRFVRAIAPTRWAYILLQIDRTEHKSVRFTVVG